MAPNFEFLPGGLRFLMSQDLWVIPVNEAAQGAALDGDGLIENAGVVHVIDRGARLRAP